MKTAFWIDFFSSKKMLTEQLGTALIISVCICLPMGSVYVALSAIVIALVISTGFTLFAYDEQNGWERFRVGLPMSRSEIMWGRLAFILALSITAAIFGTIACLAISALSPLFEPMLASVFHYAPDAFAIDPAMLACTVVLSIAVMSLMLAVMVPLIAKFGMTRATRLAPLAFALFFVTMVIAAGDSAVTAFNGMLSGIGPFALCGIGLAIAAGLFAFTGILASRLYENREF